MDKRAPRMTPGHHQLQGTLGVALSVHACGMVTASLPCHSCLDVSPHQHDFGFCHNRSSKLPRFNQEHDGTQSPSCVKFFKRVMTPVIIWILFHYFATRWLQLVARMADGRLSRAFRKCLSMNHLGKFQALTGSRTNCKW